MNDKTYTYNATDQGLAAWNRNFTSRIGDGSGDPEEEFLSLVRLIATCKSGAKCLDLGCGHGRIIELVKHSAGAVVGLEPDFERFRSCHGAHHDGHRIHIFHSSSQEYKNAHPEDRFDIVIVSMVLQHVPTWICDQILRDVHELLMPDGVAIVATAQQDVERFVCQSNPAPLTAEEFDHYAADTANQQWGLPVRNFSRASLIQAIGKADLRMIHWGQFSYVRPEKLSWYAALVNVSPEVIEDVGVSQYAVVKRLS
jgi:ubiquinone/menaquinone biosynthesis C-methylase UbiE